MRSGCCHSAEVLLQIVSQGSPPGGGLRFAASIRHLRGDIEEQAVGYMGLKSKKEV